jgi:hypothetical protein
MLIPFTGQAYKAKYPSLNGQRCVNWYPVTDQANGKTQLALYPTPGYTLFTNGAGNEGRGCFEWKGIGYKVVDDTFYEVTAAGVETSKGTLLTSTGRVKFAVNPTQIMIIDGTYGYVYTISTGAFTRITDTDFPANPISLDYQDGFAFIVARHADGMYRLYFCNTNDFTSWTATDVVTPTYKADNTRAALSNKEVLYVLSDLSAEIYINNDGVIERQPRSAQNYGIGATDSALQIDESVIFLSKDRHGSRYVVQMSGSPDIKPISDSAVTFAINSYKKVDDAFAWGISWEDRLWYVLTFPTENVTWVYDLTTQSWFEWASLSSSVNASATPGRHTANGYMNLAGKHIICDYESGKLFQLKNIKFADAPTETPTISLQASKDKGHVWTNERWRQINIGQYLKRLVWLGLGTARDWMFRLKFADTINTENGRTVIRTRETAHLAIEDKYLSISSLRIDVGIEPAPFVILGAYANSSYSGVVDDGNK